MTFQVKVKNVRTEVEAKEEFDIEDGQSWLYGRMVGKTLGKVWDGTARDEFVVRVRKV